MKLLMGVLMRDNSFRHRKTDICENVIEATNGRILGILVLPIAGEISN